MARKSRKNAAAEPVYEAAPLQIFPTAIYARLSVENSGKSEKVDVITNQIEICKSYIAGCPYLDLVDVYVDNGRTGTVFDTSIWAAVSIWKAASMPPSTVNSCLRWTMPSAV